MPPACRIVDVPDDLSWALFAYSGAAAAAGQAYTGAVLCTADGQWPAANQEERVTAALRSAFLQLSFLCMQAHMYCSVIHLKGDVMAQAVRH
jgi:hypothetical protein